jgi:hypothetical protein
MNDDLLSWAKKIEGFRFHPSFHLGLGDIRLSAGDNEDLCILLRAASADNERLREALKFITTTRPDGTPAYSEALMFDVAADALKATMQVHYPADRL